ncbi:hypothetical protein HZH66_000778 [Vespula vulgaris]|uniref:Uncharacterized protein n=1 Tax=Vespula vulgaris TaxID=7454 RepID=A0A834KTR3_VESVU|nr:hypothetical protein HZH66_000778 [Vespula vulgaris]
MSLINKIVRVVVNSTNCLTPSPKKKYEDSQYSEEATNTLYEETTNTICEEVTLIHEDINNISLKDDQPTAKRYQGGKRRRRTTRSNVAINCLTRALEGQAGYLSLRVGYDSEMHFADKRKLYGGNKKQLAPAISRMLGRILAKMVGPEQRW